MKRCAPFRIGQILILGGTVLSMSAFPAEAGTVTAPPARPAIDRSDCPLAGLPFSIDTPLFDIVNTPQAKQVVDSSAPKLLNSLPPYMTSQTLPSLAAILPLRTISAWIGKTRTAEIDQALKGIPITPDIDRRRCARYDAGPPPILPEIVARPAILVFDKSNGFRDGPSVEAATAALRSMASENGWQLVFTDRPAFFNHADLAKFAAVVWNNVSGDVLSLRQRAAFRDYIERGGGYVGIHGSGGDPVTFWDWYVDTLVGARFKGHPAAPQFQEARVKVEEPGSELVAGLGDGWTMTDEWYSFQNNPRDSGAHVLVTLDETSYKPEGMEGSLRMGDHPIAWTRCVGAGRSFYTAIGHLPQTYRQAAAMQLLANGLRWAAGGVKACSPNR